MSAVRNTTTERRCPDCEGGGELLVVHASGNPQLDDGRRCPRCAGDGWIRWAPVDAIEQLASARRNFRHCFPSGEIAGRHYGNVRSRVVSPVNLPADLPGTPETREAIRVAEQALEEDRAQQAFAAIFGQRAA